MKVATSTVTVWQLAEERLKVKIASVMPELPSTTVRSSMDRAAGKLAENATGADVARAPTLSTATAVSRCWPAWTYIQLKSKGASNWTPSRLE